MNENIKKMLGQFEENPKRTTAESAIYLMLTKAGMPSDGLSNADQAELLAFGIAEPYANNELPSWPYYGFLNPDEGEGGSPIKDAHVRHWNVRMNETLHPTLKARYAGLTWQYSKQILNEIPDFKIAQAFVLSIVEIIENRLYNNSLDAKSKMGIALSTAVSLNNPSLIEQIKACIIRYERAIPPNEIKAHWGVAYDFLFGKNIKRLSEKEINDMVTLLEERLIQLKKIDPWATEAVAVRLAKFYKSYPLCGLRAL